MWLRGTHRSLTFQEESKKRWPGSRITTHFHFSLSVSPFLPFSLARSLSLPKVCYGEVLEGQERKKKKITACIVRSKMSKMNMKAPRSDILFFWVGIVADAFLKMGTLACFSHLFSNSVKWPMTIFSVREPFVHCVTARKAICATLTLYATRVRKWQRIISADLFFGCAYIPRRPA